jgi:hypothetical protein
MFVRFKNQIKHISDFQDLKIYLRLGFTPFKIRKCMFPQSCSEFENRPAEPLRISSVRGFTSNLPSSIVFPGFQLQLICFTSGRHHHHDDAVRAYVAGGGDCACPPAPAGRPRGLRGPGELVPKPGIHPQTNANQNMTNITNRKMKHHKHNKV